MRNIQWGGETREKGRERKRDREELKDKQKYSFFSQHLYNLSEILGKVIDCLIMGRFHSFVFVCMFWNIEYIFT